MLERIPKPLKNFYLISFILFAIWMLVLDENDVFTQWSRAKANRKLTDEKEHFEKEIKGVIEDRDDLRSDTTQLEKFAREKYFMKREGEDVYRIVEKEEEED